MITIKSQSEIDLMRESGRIAAEIVKKLKEAVEPGITTQELNELAEELIIFYKVKSAFSGQLSGRRGEPFSASVCTSVNNVIVHGVPSEYVLKNGDILGLDFGVVYRGYYSDLAITLPVGRVNEETSRFLRIAKKALRRGIKIVRPGVALGDIGNTIQRYVESQGYQIVRDLVGHGIGQELHEDPQIPNYGKRKTGEKLREGMVIAIEPMITEGSYEIKSSADNQGFETRDGSLAAHFEHTMAVTSNGHRILTEL